jgi:predicted nucleic-acid-binding protein
MRGLDTNVLLRLLLRDDEAQARKARALVERSVHDGEVLHVSLPALCELVWVLAGRTANLGRQEIAATIERLLDTNGFELQSRDAVREALADFRAGEADFADYLVGRLDRRAGCRDTLSFDARLAKDDGFTAPR